MKLFTLSQNENKDNHQIQRRSSLIVFTARISAQDNSGAIEQNGADVQSNYDLYQYNVLSSMDQIIVNSKLTGKKTTDLIKNFTATELMKISQTLGFPIVVKSMTGMPGYLSVSFVIPLTLDRTSIPFSSTNTLYLSVKNPVATQLDVYAIDSDVTSTTSIIRYEREILQAGQRKDYINSEDNYVNAVIETQHETDVYYYNGEVCQFLPEEFDVLNDFSCKCSLVWNNEQHSNYGNITSVPMIGVRKIAVQGVMSDANLFFVRNVNL
jgi:hypothetical protein